MVIQNLLVWLTIYFSYFDARGFYWTGTRFLLEGHEIFTTPLAQMNFLSPTKRNQNKLLTINKRTHYTKTTAYFETKLGRDDKQLIFIIRKYFWDIYSMVLVDPPPKTGPNF